LKAFIWYEGEGVIKIGMGSVQRATAIITKLMEYMWSGLGANADCFVEGYDNAAVDNETGQGWREWWITLWKAIFLSEGIKSDIKAMEETEVRVGLHEVKVMDQGMETRFGFKNVESFFLGHLVPAVDEVNKDACSGRG
jgi:hypothetical protein